MEGPRLARDLMVTRLVTVSPETPVSAGIHLLLKNRITGAPVIDAERNYLGMLSEKCCLSVLKITAQLAAESGDATATELRARDFMTRRLLTLSPEGDAFKAIELLLRQRVSGAPVIDAERRLLGVFSERYAMSMLVHSAYEGVPSVQVGAYMNPDLGRAIDEERPLLEVTQIFLDHYYRRLPVLRDGRLTGQISRRDVLDAKHNLAPVLRRYEAAMLERSGEIARNEEETGAGGPLPSSRVDSFMDRDAMTVTEETDLLTMAQIFLHTNSRRLPVLTDGKLVGQISRRDLLAATHKVMAGAPKPERALLYLSAFAEPGDPPPIG